MVLLCCPPAVAAAEWSFDPVFTATVGYETNAVLTTAPHEDVTETVFSPRLAIRRATETSAIDVGLVAVANRYSASSIDNDEGKVALASFFQTTERLKLGLDAASHWDTVFKFSALDSGTGDVQDIDVGLTTTKVRRNWRFVAPSVSYALTERSVMTLNYRLTDVEFDDVGATGLVDYTQNFVSGTYSYRLTTVTDLNVVARGARFRPESGVDSDTTGVLAGISHKFSPTASAGFRAGASNTTNTRADGSQTDASSFVLEARGAQQSELSRLDAVISGDVQPTGSGQSMSADQLRIDWRRKLSPTMAFRLRTKAFQKKALKGAGSMFDRRYAEALAGLDWTWAPEWSLGIAYQYRYQKYDVDPDSADSNGVFVALTWAPLTPR